MSVLSDQHFYLQIWVKKIHIPPSDPLNANSKSPRICSAEDAFSRPLIPLFVAVIMMSSRYSILSFIEYPPFGETKYDQPGVCCTCIVERYLTIVHEKSTLSHRPVLTVHPAECPEQKQATLATPDPHVDNLDEGWDCIFLEGEGFEYGFAVFVCTADLFASKSVAETECILF